MQFFPLMKEKRGQRIKWKFRLSTFEIYQLIQYQPIYLKTGIVSEKKVYISHKMIFLTSQFSTGIRNIIDMVFSAL